MPDWRLMVPDAGAADGANRCAVAERKLHAVQAQHRKLGVLDRQFCMHGLTMAPMFSLCACSLVGTGTSWKLSCLPAMLAAGSVK